MSVKSLKLAVISAGVLGVLCLKGVGAMTVTDVGNTIQNYFNNLQDIEHRIMEEIEKSAERALETELSKLGLESEVAQEAQKLAAEQRQVKNLRNQEVARQQAPLTDVCMDSSIISFSHDGDLDCYRDELTLSAQDDLNSRRSKMYELSNEEATIEIEKDMQETLSSCFMFLHDEGASSGGEEVVGSVSDSYCFDTSQLTDPNQTTIQSAAKEAAAEMAIKILVEPVPRKKPPRSKDVETSSGRKKLLNEQRKDMLLQLAQNVMLSNLELRRSSKWADAEKTVPLPSVIETLDLFNNNRLLSEGGEYLLKLGAVHKDKFNPDQEIAIASTFTIEQVQRETAVMTAFLTHMAILKYKSQLRIEQMEAALLGLEVNPLD